jgi:hypothetical protein
MNCKQRDSTGVFERSYLRTSARVEPIAPGIAQKIECEHRRHHGNRRKNYHEWRIEKMAARVDRTVAWRYE